jgi:hypothetical protein
LHDQHAFRIPRQLHAAVGSEIAISNRFHDTLLCLSARTESAPSVCSGPINVSSPEQ